MRNKVEILNHTILDEENYQRLLKECPDFLSYVTENAVRLRVGEGHDFSLKALKKKGWLIFRGTFHVMESEDGGYIKRIMLTPCIFEEEPRVYK